MSQPTQVDEEECSIGAIVGRVSFRRGMQDIAAGRDPDFDSEALDEYLAYERGRQFAVLCKATGHPIPHNRCGRRLNPTALILFERFSEDIR